MRPIRLALNSPISRAIVLTICFSAALAGQTPAVTAPQDGSGLKTETNRAQENASHRASLVTAVAFARAGNISAVETELVRRNRNKRDSAGWHIETAQRLLQVAERVSREGRPDISGRVASVALDHLGKADSITNDAKLRASAQVLKGWVYERYLGDNASALLAYQAADQISPENNRGRQSAARIKQPAGAAVIQNPAP